MRLHKTTAILALIATMGFAHSQLPLNVGSTPSSEPTNELGGTPTIDVITLRSGMLGVPLRYGGVIAGSERVEVNGRVLRRGTEYQIDATSGVIYLMRGVKHGDLLRVGYRYDSARSASNANSSQFAGIAPFKFELTPGSRLLLGFGMAERLADGNIVQTDIYGLNNKFKFGSGKLDGLFLMGNRSEIQSESDYEFRTKQQAQDIGRSHFTLQNMVLGLGGGGSIDINYQDISKNFSGFAAVSDAGYEAKQIDQLRKERGLKRFQLGLNQVGLGSMKFSGSMKSIEDNGEGVTWQSMGIASGGFNLNWKSQKVSDAFTRFKDIAEADREQLKKEVGMERETLSGSFAQRANKFSFSINQITDPDSASIERRELEFENERVKLWYGDQEIDGDFARMGSLMDREKAMWGRELGMSRQWFGLQSTLFGPKQPISFSQNILASQAGEYIASDWKYQGAGWSLEGASRGVSENFAGYGSMQDSERNENINAIGKMYDSNGVAFRGEEVQWFNNSSGISRNLTRLQSQLFKDTKLRIDHLQLAGKLDSATLDTFSLQGKKFQIDFRRQELGDQFHELARLLELERNRLGVISGLERTDFNVSLQMNPNRKFLYSLMKAEAPNGNAGRQHFAYSDPNIQVSMNAREVDPGFTNVSQLVDPEKDFLATMVGFRERDVKADWKISPNLSLSAFLYDSASAALDQDRYIRNYELKYQPGKATNVMARHFQEKSQDPLSVLFANSIDLLSVTHDFGTYGKLAVLTESRDYEGTNASLLDFEKRYFGYEAKLNPTTSIKTESTTTTFESGSREQVTANTVSSDLSKHMGVSVTQMNIDRDGDENDEKKRGYGFWFDIASGIRIAYGYAQHRAGETIVDTQNQNATLTGGTVGNLQVGNSSYLENQWEGGRTQALGNISLSTVKPMSFLGISDLKIKASLDTSADRTVWLKENQMFSLSGKLGSNAVAFDFRSQIAPSGLRGIDRSVNFTTDQDEKRPIRLNMKYKMRHLPDGSDIIIRDYAVVAKPAKNVELTHSLITNPEVARGDVILGSITQARQENKWKLDYKSTENLIIGGEWREFADQGQPRIRLGGVNFTINKSSGSPVGIFYGVEESDAGGTRHRTDRYHIRFDQRPGPHQTLSFFVGNVSYLRGMQQGTNRDNFTVQLNYQIKF